MNAQVQQLASLYRPDDRVEHLRVPPQSVEAEQAVLGGLMLVPEAFDLVSDTLDDRDFYRRDHQQIFRAIRELHDKSQPFDAVTMGEWFESTGQSELVSGGAYLIELANTTPSAANIRAYADIVRDKATLRKLIDIGSNVVNDAFQPDGRDTSEIIANLQHQLVEVEPQQRGGFRKVSDTMGDWYDRFATRSARGVRVTGLPTPWSELNDITHGLQPATLYLLAARPSMGKSAAALNLAMFTALRGKRVGLFSLEMDDESCNSRFVAALAGVSHDWIVAPDDNDQDSHASVNYAIQKLRSADLFVDTTPSLTVRQFVARARRMHRRAPLDLLVIDHIHDFRIDAKLARFEYGEICQAAKTLAKEWGIPVVALAQLNRNVSGRNEKRPTLADLRESGEIEQKADVIIFLHREDYYDTPDHKTHLQGVIEMNIAKGRNIKAGDRIYLRNRFDQARIEDWTGPLPRPVAKKKGDDTLGFDV